MSNKSDVMAVKASQKGWINEAIRRAGEVNIFSAPAPQFQSDLSVISCAARHLSSYLFNPMQELQSDEKVGKWSKLSHLFTSSSFSFRCQTASKLLMIPKVKWQLQIWASDTEPWCLTARRLQRQRVSFLFRRGNDASDFWVPQFCRVKRMVFEFWCWRSDSYMFCYTKLLFLTIVPR